MELLQDIGHRYQDAFGAEDGSSLPMRRGILRWLGLYFGDREDLLRLPYTIVRKLCRAMLCEYQAEGFAAQLPVKEAMELALIAGESYLRPGDGNWQAISRGDVFTRENVRRIRAVRWCCGGVGLICVPAAFCYYPLVFMVIIMGFLFLVVSVVCQVMDAAVTIREENDLTI